ncbi:hypothetical protein ECPA5_4940, partial [Escherichia coli PA5]
MITKKNRFL